VGSLEHKADSYPLSYFSLPTCKNKLYCSFFECFLMPDQDTTPFFPVWDRQYIEFEWAKGREHSDMLHGKAAHHRPLNRRVALLGQTLASQLSAFSHTITYPWISVVKLLTQERTFKNKKIERQELYHFLATQVVMNFFLIISVKINGYMSIKLVRTSCLRM